ncbi:major capsid protein [Labrys portucalensis]|uniref:Major capsid protein n=1 Tax=Labrys neptuniae TaxID=376174 RepID=A0ABV6ZJY0_9HYPH
MPDMNIFDEDPFTAQSLTLAINNVPATPGQVGQIVDFEAEGITTTDVPIANINGSLELVEPSARGGPGETVDHDKWNLRKISTAHFQRDEHVLADEVQNVRDNEMTGQTALMTVEKLVNNKLARHARDFDLNDEWMKVGVINGKVVSGKGKVVLDIYQEFGITPAAVVEFDLTNEAFGFRKASMNLVMSMEDDLLATGYGHVHTLCGREFFLSILDNEEYKSTFLNTTQAAQLRDAQPDIVTVGGVTYERYKSSKVARDAVGGNFIPDDEARAFFVGVPGLYLSRYAPADYWDTVNTMGLPRYSREMTSQRTEKAAKFEVQTNPLHVITQPKTLRKLKLKP